MQLTNPTSSTVTYYLSPSIGATVSTTYSVTVGPDSTADDPLLITPYETQATPSTIPFSVAVTDYDNYTPSAAGTASATLDVSGPPVLQSTPNAYGVVAALLAPASATAGQDTTASYVLQITNTGSTEEEFYEQIPQSGSPGGLPTGSYGGFGRNYFEVQPGAGNFVDVPLTVNVGSVAQGTYTFTVIVSATDGTSSTTATGTLIVEPSGVYVYLYPSSGPPGTTFDAYITNEGSEPDTFDLALSGAGRGGGQPRPNDRDERPPAGIQPGDPDHHESGHLRHRGQPAVHPDRYLHERFGRHGQRQRVDHRPAQPRPYRHRQSRLGHPASSPDPRHSCSIRRIRAPRLTPTLQRSWAPRDRSTPA